jgi:hypothetical protein
VRSHRPPFARIILAAFAAQALLMATTLAYMMAFQHLIDPGRVDAHYVEHARLAAPIISIVAGALIFFTLALGLGRASIQHRVFSAILFWVLFVAVAGGIAYAIDGVRGLTDSLAITAVAHLVKLAAALFGARASVGAHSIAS